MQFRESATESGLNKDNTGNKEHTWRGGEIITLPNLMGENNPYQGDMYYFNPERYQRQIESNLKRINSISPQSIPDGLKISWTNMVEFWNTHYVEALDVLKKAHENRTTPDARDVLESDFRAKPLTNAIRLESEEPERTLGALFEKTEKIQCWSPQATQQRIWP